MSQDEKIMELQEKIENLLAASISAELTQQGISYNPESSSDIILSYLNYRNKWVSCVPKKVKYSKELTEKINTFSPELINQINYFQVRFEKGDNINGHLSRQIYNSEKKDMLLNSWNIKHLHINPITAMSNKEMMNNRANYLLFFTEDDSYVYFFDVLEHPHGAGFANYHFLQIAHSNSWMKLINFEEINEIIDLSIPEITNNDDIYYFLFKNKINTMFKFGNKFYASIGVSSAGNPMMQTFVLANIKQQLLDIAQIMVEENVNVSDCFIMHSKDTYSILFSLNDVMQYHQVFIK